MIQIDSSWVTKPFKVACRYLKAYKCIYTNGHEDRWTRQLWKGGSDPLGRIHYWWSQYCQICPPFLFYERSFWKQYLLPLPGGILTNLVMPLPWCHWPSFLSVESQETLPFTLLTLASHTKQPFLIWLTPLTVVWWGAETKRRCICIKCLSEAALG